MTLELPRILLAEDSPNDVELTLTALGELNVANEVVVVSDGAEALDFLNCRGKFKTRPQGNPAVILLDIKMPRVDGIEVLKKVRESKKLRMIPVVMLTSSREESDIVETYNQGVNAYVVKPVDFAEFIEAVKNVGLFWAMINEPPPKSTPRLEYKRAKTKS